MKHLLQTIILLISISVQAQSPEFIVHSNGLIYNENTMEQLEFIVDSLNLQYRTCELQKSYLSKSQTHANYIKLNKGNIKEAKKDLDSNISFEDFLEQYPKAAVEEELLVVKFKYVNYNDEDVVDFNSYPIQNEITVRGNPEIYSQNLKGKWIYTYWQGSEHSDESIRAFYFIEEFQEKELSLKYAKMVQYTDCLIDTNQTIYLESAYETGVRRKNKENKNIQEFMQFIDKHTNRPKYGEKDYQDYRKEYREWDSVRFEIIDAKLAKTDEFTTLLTNAVSEALEFGGSYDEFETYVGLYYSKETELELKRSRIVIGGCSMDDSPRIHAMNIAILSAETIHWETFLRAHLDIMNDRFQRASDGSYAWGRRQTYIRELEELNINVTDLLLGISLRIENPSKNHYYGSIGRVGRALSESQYAEAVESKMLEMIKDTELDEYNRIIMYYLFRNYNFYIVDEAQKNENIEKLKTAVNELPPYLRTKIKFEN